MPHLTSELFFRFSPLRAATERRSTRSGPTSPSIDDRPVMMSATTRVTKGQGSIGFR